MLPVEEAPAPQNGRLFLAADQLVNICIAYGFREIAPLITPSAKQAEFGIVPRSIGAGTEHICFPPGRIIIVPSQKARDVLQNGVSVFQGPFGIPENQPCPLSVFRRQALRERADDQNVQIIQLSLNVPICRRAGVWARQALPPTERPALRIHLLMRKKEIAVPRQLIERIGQRQLVVRKIVAAKNDFHAKLTRPFSKQTGHSHTARCSPDIRRSCQSVPFSEGLRAGRCL